MPKGNSEREYIPSRKGFHAGRKAAIFEELCKPGDDVYLAKTITEHLDFGEVAIDGYREGHLSMSTDDSWEAWRGPGGDGRGRPSVSSARIAPTEGLQRSCKSIYKKTSY